MSDDDFGEELGQLPPDLELGATSDQTHATRPPNQADPAGLDRRRCGGCGASASRRPVSRSPAATACTSCTPHQVVSAAR